jgi:hypothetical protein
MNYLIVDTTENTGRMYIGEGGENCNLEENAMVFATEKEACEKIEKNGWGDWASTMETDYPVNSDGYIYHGTGKGQALNIQRDGYMKPNKTGEEQPSISFTNDLDYAKYHAKSKGGVSKMCILRTKLTDDYQLSPRIVNNKGDEYITFKNVPSSELEVMTMGDSWQPLDTWNVIFNEPLNT